MSSSKCESNVLKLVGSVCLFGRLHNIANIDQYEVNSFAEVIELG